MTSHKELYTDQFTVSDPMFTVINTVIEWHTAENDLGKQLKADAVEVMEFNSACVVCDYLERMVGE